MSQEENSVIVLTDENGNDVNFQFLDSVEYEGEEYVVLASMDNFNGEVEILKVVYEDGTDEDTFVGIESEETLNAVFEIFKKNFSDELTF